MPEREGPTTAAITIVPRTTTERCGGRGRGAGACIGAQRRATGVQYNTAVLYVSGAHPPLPLPCLLRRAGGAGDDLLDHCEGGSGGGVSTALSANGRCTHGPGGAGAAVSRAVLLALWCPYHRRGDPSARHGGLRRAAGTSRRARTSHEAPSPTLLRLLLRDPLEICVLVHEALRGDLDPLHLDHPRLLFRALVHQAGVPLQLLILLGHLAGHWHYEL